jgi:hypothetical protein
MPPTISRPSKIRGSIGLIRGKPSDRSVASMHRFPVFAWRRTKISAMRGAPSANSSHVLMAGDATGKP